jgi:hypothetical protein
MEPHVNTNKQFRIYDVTGKFNRFSVDEVIANNFNRWNGWQCSAGVRGLYIDYDGNVWIGNCASSSRNKNSHYDSWQNFIDSEWKKTRDAIFGPIPHRKWRSQNTGRDNVVLDDTATEWVLTQDDWDNSEKILTVKFKEVETEFFSTLETKLRKKFNANGSGFQWQATPDDIGNVWGLLGNIYNTWSTTTEWTECKIEACGCGADVILSKSKDIKSKDHLHVTKYKYNGQYDSLNLQSNILSEHVAVEMDFPIDYQILWDISRRCNFSCSYCWPSVHNNTDPHHDWEVIQATLYKAINEWAYNNPIRWNFGGGEPTLHPKFLDILKILKDNKQWTMVTTNGSLKSAFWHKAKKLLNSVNFSCHFEKVDEEQFINNVKIVLDWHDECNDDLWCEIKLMAPPGVVKRALAMKDIINSLETFNRPGLNGRKKGAISIVPIRGLTDSNALVDYTEEELEILRTQ